MLSVAIFGANLCCCFFFVVCFVFYKYVKQTLVCKITLSSDSQVVTNIMLIVRQSVIHHMCMFE